MPCKISDFLLLLLASILLSACATKRDIDYFQGANTSKSLKILSTSKAIQYENTTIQPNDILSLLELVLLLRSPQLLTTPITPMEPKWF